MLDAGLFPVFWFNGICEKAAPVVRPFAFMILKLNEEEIAELQKHEMGPFGEDHFHSFIAELCARLNDNGELDVGRDELERIETYRKQKHKERLDKVLKRPLDEALRKFFE